MLRLTNISKTFNPGTEDAKLALDNVSLHVRPGDFISIIGANGAGKSTLFGAIAGSFITDTGDIILDGEDITLTPEYKRSKQIGRLFQDPMRGSAPGMTIEENLALAAGKGGWLHRLTKQEKKQLRERVALLGMGLEDRMSQPVGLLSGGQRQRIAIARAILKNPRILILDEATSALDTESERVVQEALDRLMVGRTSFVIAHRLSTVKNADKILVLEKGNLVESGTHDELLALDGLYAHLYKIQYRNKEAK